MDLSMFITQFTKQVEVAILPSFSIRMGNSSGPGVRTSRVELTGFTLTRRKVRKYFYFCDIERSIVVKTTPYGEEVLRIGYPEESPAYQVASDGEKPVYKPTNLTVSPNGDIYVADGYGSSYVIQYDKYGRYIRTFGGPGSEAGQLKCPHGIICDSRGEQPVVLVADRSNNRLQEFSLEGEHRHFYYGFDLPCHFHIRGKDMVIPDLAARVTVVDEKNEVVAHLGQGPADYRELRLKTRNAFPVGQFICPHGASFDSEGNIFVGEWVETWAPYQASPVELTLPAVSVEYFFENLFGASPS